jgi:ECF-type riboflavin transporter, S component/Prenyltransferase and squalene oxidase repeat
LSWELGSTAIVVLALAVGFAWYERGRPSSKLVAVVAALAALALAGRVVFTPIPNVQATTDIVLLSGYALGPAPGFVVGSVGALTSNFLLGQGPWTPWQMLGWGMTGVAGGGLAIIFGRRLGRWPLALACAAAGFVFGAWMDLFTVLSFAAERSVGSYFAVAGVSLPFNVAHAVGNFVLCLAFGPGFVRMLARFRRRLEVRWVPAGEFTAGAGLLLVLLALSLQMHAPPAGAAQDGGALRYLGRAQNADGGFGAAPDQSSSQLITGWAALGLEAAGRNPLDVKRSGRTPIDFMRTNARELNDTGELERTILALRGAGVDPRKFAGRDLVAELLRRRRSDGSFEALSNLTAFGVLALRSAGRPASSVPVAAAARWLAAHQNDDGGFSISGKGASFVDETGAALQALAEAGRRGGKAARRASGFLRRAQADDGGYGQSQGYRSNAQSTAWAVQGIVATGGDPASFKRHGARSPVAYLASLQQGDGSYRYSRASVQTAQVVAALRHKAFPLRPVRRAAGARAAPGRAPERRPAHKSHARVRERAERPDHRSPTRAVAVRSTSVTAPPTAAKRDSSGPSPLLYILLPAAAIAAGLWLGRRRARRRR